MNLTKKEMKSFRSNFEMKSRRSHLSQCLMLVSHEETSFLLKSKMKLTFKVESLGGVSFVEMKHHCIAKILDILFVILNANKRF